MVKKIVAIVIIYIFATIAWLILGGTIFSRTYSSNDNLKGQVASIWGSAHNQTPPIASTTKEVAEQVESEENGKKILRTISKPVTDYLTLDSSDIDVSLGLEHRQKGLLWYSTYTVDLHGTYAFRNTTSLEDVTFTLNFPTSQAIYDDLVFSINDMPTNLNNISNSISTTAKVKPGQTAILKIAYKSQGLDQWSYNFGNNVSQVHNFNLNMHTNFPDIDFPKDALSPTKKLATAQGWDLTWSYKNLISGFQIGMIMPEKLQPGPLAGSISLFAPVSLFFFFFLMFIITTLRNIEMHPMNYFFLATGFFAFHLLLAYLVDHISIHTAFIICSAVSIFLVVSYLRLAVGLKFALREAALGQFVYLVLFSYAFFFKGFTGLAITIGSIITLFVVMQMTGRIKWADKFAPKMTIDPEKVRQHAAQSNSNAQNSPTTNL